MSRGVRIGGLGVGVLALLLGLWTVAPWSEADPGAPGEGSGWHTVRAARLEADRATLWSLPGPGEEIRIQTWLELPAGPDGDGARPYALSIRALDAQGRTIWAGEHWEIGRAPASDASSRAVLPGEEAPRLAEARSTWVGSKGLRADGAEVLEIRLARPADAAVRLRVLVEEAPRSGVEAAERFRPVEPISSPPLADLRIRPAPARESGRARPGFAIHEGRRAAVNVGGPTHLSCEVAAGEEGGGDASYLVRAVGEEGVFFRREVPVEDPPRPVVIPIPEGTATVSVRPRGFRGRVRFFVARVRSPSRPVALGAAREGEWSEIQPELALRDLYRTRSPEGGGPDTPVEAEVVPGGDGPPRLLIEARSRVPAGAPDLPRELRLRVRAVDRNGEECERATLVAYPAPSRFDTYPGEPPDGVRPTEPVRFRLTLPPEARSIRVTSDGTVDVAFLAPLGEEPDRVAVPGDDPAVPGVTSEPRRRGVRWLPYQPSNTGLLRAIHRTTSVLVQRRIHRTTADGRRVRGTVLRPTPVEEGTRRRTLVPGLPEGAWGGSTFHPVPANRPVRVEDSGPLWLAYRDRRPGGPVGRLVVTGAGRPLADRTLDRAGLVPLDATTVADTIEVGIRGASGRLPPPPERFDLLVSAPVRDAADEEGTDGGPSREGAAPSRRWKAIPTWDLPRAAPLAFDLVKGGRTPVSVEVLCLLERGPRIGLRSTSRLRLEVGSGEGEPLVSRTFELAPEPVSPDGPFRVDGRSLARPVHLSVRLPATASPGTYRARLRLDGTPGTRAQVALRVVDGARGTVRRGRPALHEASGPGHLRLALGDDPVLRGLGFRDIRLRWRVHGTRGSGPVRDAPLRLSPSRAEDEGVEVELPSGPTIVEVRHGGDRPVPVRAFVRPDGGEEPHEVVPGRELVSAVRTDGGRPVAFLVPEDAAGRRLEVLLALPAEADAPGEAARVGLTFHDAAGEPIGGTAGTPLASAVARPIGAFDPARPDALLAGPTVLHAIVPRGGTILSLRCTREALLACRVGPDARRPRPVVVPAPSPVAPIPRASGVEGGPRAIPPVNGPRLREEGRLRRLLVPRRSVRTGPVRPPGSRSARRAIRRPAGPVTEPRPRASGEPGEVLEPVWSGPTGGPGSTGDIWTRIPGDDEEAVLCLPRREGGGLDPDPPPGSPPVRLRCEYALPTTRARVAVRVTVDGEDHRSLSLASGKGRFSIEGIPPGTRTVGFETEAPGAVFFVDRPPASRERGPEFARRTVTPIRPGDPLACPFEREGNEPVRLTTVLHLPASVDPDAVGLRLSLEPADATDEGSALSPWPTPLALGVRLADAPTTDVHPLDDLPPRRVRIHRVTLPIGRDAPTGLDHLRVELVGPEEVEARVRFERVAVESR